MPSVDSLPGPVYPRSVPVLGDGVVTLRAHRRADAAALVEQGNDPDTLRWTTVPRPYRRADALRFLAHVRQAWSTPGGDRVWALEWTDDGGTPRFGGSVDLRPRPGRVADIGFALHPDARGRGLMARAVRLVAAYGFETGLGDGPLERIHWAAVVGNFASRRVVWACGFAHHGTIPQSGPAYPADGGGVEVRDHWWASLGRGDAMAPRRVWLDVPVLDGEGVRLRPWRENDAEHSEPLTGPAHHMPLEAAPDDLTFDAWLLERRERQARGTGIYWCIADPVTDRPLGAVMVFDHARPIDPPGAELGYFLFPSARGRGFATAAAECAADWAFLPRARGGLGLTRLAAYTAADNLASNAVLERVGFVRWGVEHETDTLPDGTAADTYAWELLASTR